MPVSHDLIPLRRVPPGGAQASAADAFWSAFRTPRSPRGAFLLIRLTPAHGFAPPAAHEVAFRLYAAAKSFEGCEGVPEVTPIDAGVSLVCFAGNFEKRDLRLLRDRVRGILLRWALDGGSVVRGDVTVPYVWSEQVDRQEADGERALPADALFRLLAEKDLHALYQPIVSLHDGGVLGWEALCKGPKGTPLETSDAVFECAARVDLVGAVEGLAREVALRSARALAGRGVLFLNVHPEVAEGSEEAVSAGMLVRSLARSGVPASRVVVEVAERHAEKDFPAFVQALRAYREAGFRIAVDHVGAGYASLRAIAELVPDYVKVDRSLIRDIDTAPNGRALLSVIAQFAVRIGSHLIADGVETVAELNTLMEMGIGLGQGNLLAPAAAVPPPVTPGVVGQITATHDRRSHTRVGKNQAVQDLLVTMPTLKPDDRISVVQDLYGSLSDQDGLAVTDEAGRPVGLLMKRSLLSRLALPFGHELYQRKTVAVVMDPDPLVVPNGLSIEDATNRILNRDQGKLDDHVIVTLDGRYVGVAPARRLLERVTLQRISQARYANPLTGLPGNIPVEAEVNARLTAGQPVAILYVDLDNFKPYNDRYGVAHGDEVIGELARTLRQVVEDEAEEGRDFLGHVGGDDFILVTTPAAAVPRAAAIASRFEERVAAFYDREDRERGYVEGRDRRGAAARFPLVSVSVAGVVNLTMPLRDFVHATECLSKGRLKRCPGSGYLIEGLEGTPVHSGGVPREVAEGA